MKRYITAFILLSLFLWGADINSTIARGNVKIYESLLATLKKEGRMDDTKALQQALLYKLINISKNPPVEKIKIKAPSDEKAYRDLTRMFVEWSLSKSRAKKAVESIENKLGMTADQLKKERADSPDLLTLQLQYAFYLKSKLLYLQKLDRYEEAISKAAPLFIEGVKQLAFDVEAARERVRKLDRSLEKLEKEIQKLDVERERLDLLGRSSGVKRIDRQIDLLKAKKRKLINSKLTELFVDFSAALHDKRKSDVFRLQKEIMDIIKIHYPKDVQEDFRSLFNTMETAILGKAETIKGATLEEMKRMVSLFWQKINTPLFTINGTPISAFKLFMAIFIFYAGTIIGWLYKKSIKRLAYKNSTLTQSTQTLLSNLGHYAIVIIAFFIALNVMGINLSSIALVAGALSVGIGFGLQNIVSNFVSGLILMFEHTIKIGDYIEIDENLRGHVGDIRMRSTTITTNDNIDIIIPNQDLVQNRVVNWTMNDRIKRFRIPFGVAYGNDVHKVAGIIKEAVKKSGFGDICSDSVRYTRVIMVGMNESSVDFELFVWIKGGEILYPLRTKSRFLMLIYDALYEANIEIPFPQRDIHIRSVDDKISLELKTQNDITKKGKSHEL